MTEQPPVDLDARRVNSRRRRRPLNSHRLGILLGQRDDIHGVSQVADFITESVRWSA